MSPAKFKKREAGENQLLPAKTTQSWGRELATADAPAFGIALGGGGARGLSHAVFLEALDELGIRPALIAGTSIGAIVGAAYASGMSGAEIQEYVRSLLSNRTQLIARLYAKAKDHNIGSLLLKGSALPISGTQLLEALMPPSLPATFEELVIPFLSVTTDFVTQRECVLSKGPLIPAIAASAALPGILKPVEMEHALATSDQTTLARLLVDGGFVNPLPFDLLRDRASIVAAVDVSAQPKQPGGRKIPGMLETMVGSMHIALATIVREKLKVAAPHILVQPAVGRFGVLDFFKYEDIFAAARLKKDEFKRACEAAFRSSSGKSADNQVVKY